ncbi:MULTISPECIES: bifunctional riboflavin kinase/FAD synthetase [Flavobacteriaceae]|uniref:Riboflavin biosynthesis protein n=1 Tax=Flagellimonas sp. MMG031 TaxID=3158549 RepID=A0AAU7N0Z8_9FLAO|nr:MULTISPECIES: bifunctional riboflavin kinase/FAD synthetase [unclassified Allomuricauda]MBO6531782.1 bifunctional riboflavin kinase/FAD synthetase [Allomuricauda sp.]MBO6588324.1 bifunctional riboflavin kinase/FAD synthetase [Allomuricauda sp.]MBO6617949.1 bifunctional riboflavin kinase/FAD synthetase [Allomuricauda sp.]MBO6643040.1 bifunctional riboflavin kinase/FAD synthetase [Allomuricauda sp.]MBO6746284.1 bifunctional riboflavin kinase/FAD synthetase [Allomuricauda sp.]
METIQNISHFKQVPHQTVVTIGTFDGVHLGHRKILERITNNAKNTGLKSTVLTFFPHPRMVLQKDVDIKLLNTLEEKKQILEGLGLDYLIIHPFTKQFSRLSAIDFVRDILVNNIKAKRIIIGYDHRFGRNRNANIKDLISFGNTFDFEVEEIPAQEIEDVSVSSTKIRKALLDGDVETANSYLNYAYMLTGTVKKGRGLGRDFGFPTANLHIAEEYKLIPKNGAYVVKSHLDGKEYYGMMNIGFNPTVDGSKKSIEINFFEFDGNLYEKKIQVALLHRIRDEHKFNSIEELKEQLKKDKNHSLDLISK